MLMSQWFGRVRQVINNNELHLPNPHPPLPLSSLAATYSPTNLVNHCVSDCRLSGRSGGRGLRQLSGRGLSLRKTSFVQMVSWRRRRHQVACPGLGSRQLQRNNSYCCQLNRSSVDICVCHIMRQSREGGQEMSSANLRPKNNAKENQ